MSTNSIFGTPLKDRTGVADTWNPKKPCDIFNPLPQAKWPYRFNTKVFFISKRGEIEAGRVSWYHPARAADKSSCITVGRPFYNIRKDAEEFGSESNLIGAENVFPGTKAGYADARAAVFDNLVKAIAQEETDSARRIAGLREEQKAVIKMIMPK